MSLFLPLDESNAAEAAELFNAATGRGEQYYRPLQKEEFVSVLLTPRKAGDRILAAQTADKSGFIIGHYDGQIRRFFLTMIQVAPEHRRQGIGTSLVAWLQSEAETLTEAMASKGIEADPSLEISYFNPATLTWDLPGTPHHYHNNAHGVLLGSPAHLFFKNLGFRDTSTQNTYYQRLTDYEWPTQRMEGRLQRLAEAGYTVELYDTERNFGVEGLVRDLNNSLWSRQIPEEIHREGGPRPFPILSEKGEMRGFAGPVVVEEDGRAWFLGVAVHSACRGLGAATVLFHTLVNEFKKAGAVYMTFFTAEDNFARNIYEGAGFRIYASWATMRRPCRRNL